MKAGTKALGGIALLAAASAALAEDRRAPQAPAPLPEVFARMTECRTLVSDAERLACYDQRVAAVESAARSREIVVADQAQVERARRGLFGFAAPLGRLLGIGDDDTPDTPALNRLETTVSEVRHTRDGTLKLVFAEGGTWEQTDNRGFPLTPRVGNRAVIVRGALGSYFVSVDGMSGIKFRRVE